jgi:hypothetical protein
MCSTINHMRRRSQQITAVILFDLPAPLENQQMLALSITHDHKNQGYIAQNKH